MQFQQAVLLLWVTDSILRCRKLLKHFHNGIYILTLYLKLDIPVLICKADIYFSYFLNQISSSQLSKESNVISVTYINGNLQENLLE